MTTGKTPKDNGGPNTPASHETNAKEPGWANGLRQIYDSVVDEPLPDSFNDLLAKLDDPSA